MSTHKAMQFSQLISEDGVFNDGDWIESKDQDPKGDVRLIQLADIGVAKFVNKSSRFMTLQRAEELKCTFLEKGDVLIARMPDPIGRACIFPGDRRRCVTVVDICIVRPVSSDIDSKWLMYMINSEIFHNKILQFVTGTTRQRISRKNLASLDVLVPPLPVQKQIAAVLEKADTLRLQCQQMEQELNALAQSVFLDMFGDIKHQTDLSEHLHFVTSGSRGWAKYYTENGARFIRSLDVQMNELGTKNVAFVNPPIGKETERAKVEPGDVLLTITGSRIGRVCWMMDDIGEAYISQHVAILRLKNTLLPEFLSYYMSLPMLGQRQIESMQYGQTKPGLNLNQIRSFSIPVIPIVKQKEFISRVEIIRNIRLQCSSCYCEYDLNFNSLMQRAFKGELELKDVA